MQRQTSGVQRLDGLSLSGSEARRLRVTSKDARRTSNDSTDEQQATGTCNDARGASKASTAERRASQGNDERHEHAAINGLGSGGGSSVHAERRFGRALGGARVLPGAPLGGFWGPLGPPLGTPGDLFRTESSQGSEACCFGGSLCERLGLPSAQSVEKNKRK